MTNQPKALLKIKLNAFRHKAFIRSFSAIAPFYLVNEFPKCGGTWLAQMLAAALDLPFRRNEPILFEPAVTHGHFLNPFGLKNVVVLWRDPRDVLVSFYYHCFFRNEIDNASFVEQMRHRAQFADYDDVRGNMPAFINLLAENPVSPRFSYPEFVATWAGRKGIVQTRYEDLRADAPGELLRVVKELTGRDLPRARAKAIAEQFSFENAKAAVEKLPRDKASVSFVREGSVGGWRKHFDRRAHAMLEKHGYREAIDQLGYPGTEIPN